MIDDLINLNEHCVDTGSKHLFWQQWCRHPFGHLPVIDELGEKMFAHEPTSKPPGRRTLSLFEQDENFLHFASILSAQSLNKEGELPSSTNGQLSRCPGWSQVLLNFGPSNQILADGSGQTIFEEDYFCYKEEEL